MKRWTVDRLWLQRRVLVRRRADRMRTAWSNDEIIQDLLRLMNEHAIIIAVDPQSDGGRLRPFP